MKIILFIAGWIFFSAWFLLPLFFREKIGLSKLNWLAQVLIIAIFYLIGSFIWTRWKKYLMPAK